MAGKRSKWVKSFLVITSFVLVAAGVFVYVVDPFFHFHKPLKSLNYTLKTENQRYQNDGILKKFDYDAVVIGTSLSEFFKTSQVDDIFGCNAIKVPFSAASYHEIARNIDVACGTHKVKYVIRPLDFNGRLINDKDADGYSYYPTYLYDKNPFNDVEYLFNKSVIVNECVATIVNTIKMGDGGITSFDDYCNWESSHKFGREAVVASITIEDPSDINGKDIHMTDEDVKILEENIFYNVIDQAKRYPDTQFYYFFPVQCIGRWAEYYADGNMEQRLEAEQLAIELMLEVDNIHLFSFSDHFDWATDLDNFCDVTHYASWIDTEILHIMANDSERLTKDNYIEHIQKERDFYLTYYYSDLIMEWLDSSR